MLVLLLSASLVAVEMDKVLEEVRLDVVDKVVRYCGLTSQR